MVIGPAASRTSEHLILEAAVLGTPLISPATMRGGFTFCGLLSSRGLVAFSGSAVRQVVLQVWQIANPRPRAHTHIVDLLISAMTSYQIIECLGGFCRQEASIENSLHILIPVVSCVQGRPTFTAISADTDDRFERRFGHRRELVRYVNVSLLVCQESREYKHAFLHLRVIRRRDLHTCCPGDTHPSPAFWAKWINYASAFRLSHFPLIVPTWGGEN